MCKELPTEINLADTDFRTPDGVINDITVDLVALPPNADLEQYKA